MLGRKTVSGLLQQLLRMCPALLKRCQVVRQQLSRLCPALLKRCQVVRQQLSRMCPALLKSMFSLIKICGMEEVSLLDHVPGPAQLHLQLFPRSKCRVITKRTVVFCKI